MRSKLFIAVTLLLLVFSSQLSAQRRRVRKKEKEPKFSFVDHLWYGGGLNLGFSGGNGGSVFYLGVSPMVGYKFNSYISMGPRLDVTFFTGRAQTFGGVKSYNYLDYGAGLFARAKFFRSFFVHVEGGYKSYGIPSGSADIEILRFNRNAFQLGLGYSEGGASKFGFEYLLLYDFLFPKDSPQLPIDFRVGMNYNF